MIGFESADHPVDTWLNRALDIARDHAGTVPAKQSAAAEETSATWRSSFLRMPFHRDALARRSMIVETFETACTWHDFESLHASVTAAAHDAIRDVCGHGLVTCRFTHLYPDGPAPYYGIYASGRWGNTVNQWDEIKQAVSRAIIDAGGTITHHHAVGRDHRPWYEQQSPEPFAAALLAAKGSLDPAGILNPGVLLPASR